MAFKVVRLFPQGHGELLEEAEDRGEAVLERGVQLPSLPLVEKQQSVKGNVEDLPKQPNNKPTKKNKGPTCLRPCS